MQELDGHFAARAVLVALLEWSRKAELTCDRAGLLSVQDPEVVMTTMMKMAGGGHGRDMNLGAFIQQAEQDFLAALQQSRQ